MIGWPSLPYELIGKATIIVLGLLALVAVGLVALIVAYAIWYRGLGKLINLMWRGYDVHGEHPPGWRRRVSIYAVGLQEFNLSKARRIDKELQKRERARTQDTEGGR